MGTEDKQKEPTWVYAVYVEKAFNTKMRQALHGMSGWDIMSGGTKSRLSNKFKEERDKDPEKVLWALFGDELAVTIGIPAENIIGAIKVVNRNFLEGNHQLGLN